MKILLRITLVFAAIVICMVGVKIGYYRFTNKSGYAAVTVSANKVTAVPSTEYQTKPAAPVPTPTDAPKPLKVEVPERFVIYSAADSTGSPVGSTVEKPDLASSVFIGDSVSLGFSRYCAKKGLMKDTTFLTVGSYSVAHALSTSTDESKGFKHPMYKGKEMPVLNAIAEIKPENVYFCLGINDIVDHGVEGTVKNYCKIINRVRESVPDANIYIVSTTFLVDAAQKKNLNNLNLSNLNHNMKLLCLDYDKLEYIDIMSHLQDEKYALRAEYCSDEYIHQTDSAYAVWAEMLGAKQ
ncbi:MAG: hypothetical protein IJE48_02610 [Clostridia bacterium]|nr:hypothetical protein [Clostridia bacterium]